MTNNLPDFPIDHLPMRGASDSLALIIRNQTYSYNELNKRISRLAAFLMGQGMQSGARVACWLPKTLIASLMPLAAARARLVYVPINPVLKPVQVKHIMRDSAAELVITQKSRADLLDTEHADFQVIDEATVELILADEVSPEIGALPAHFDTETLAVILYTSGSTGQPKGVMLSHRNLVLGALSVAEYLKLSPDDRVLAVLPLSFDYGQNQLLSIWTAGGCAVPLDYFNARDVIKACVKHQITTLAAVPPLWVHLTEQTWPAPATQHMRRLTNSGGALTPALVKMLRDIFGDKTDIYAMYGLTEAFRSTYLDPALIDTHPTSMGGAIPFAEIMVVKPDGQCW
jgi:acyl-CoA synthetase (AMP-forming)/AMP-acid ligase II